MLHLFCSYCVGLVLFTLFAVDNCSVSQPCKLVQCVSDKSGFYSILEIMMTHIYQKNVRLPAIMPSKSLGIVI